MHPACLSRLQPLRARTHLWQAGISGGLLGREHIQEGGVDGKEKTL